MKVGDGYKGWTEHAPFDKIIVTCSPEEVPPELVAELKEGGRMVIPVGERFQQMLYLLKKTKGKMVSEALLPTLFVPMTGSGRRKAEEAARPAPSDPDQRRFRGTQRQAAAAGRLALRRGKRRSKATRTRRRASTTPPSATASRAAGCQALQGFAVDGRKVPRLDVSLVVRGRNIGPGQTPQQLARWASPFTTRTASRSARRVPSALGSAPSTGRPRRSGSRYPPRAGSAIVRIGLLGAVGDSRWARSS